MELTTTDIRSIGYTRRDKEITKKLIPWLWAILGILMACVIALLSVSIIDVPPVTYITPDGDELVIALDYATFNGQIIDKEDESLESPIVYVSGTIGVLSIIALFGLAIYMTEQAKKAGTQFLDEWLKAKGITDLS